MVSELYDFGKSRIENCTPPVLLSLDTPSRAIVAISTTLQKREYQPTLNEVYTQNLELYKKWEICDTKFLVQLDEKA